MRTVTYSMGVSVDGYVVGPDGDFGWTAPDEEVFRFVTDEVREVGVHLLGRRLYETMLYWETADQDLALDPLDARVGRDLEAAPKVVFSTTLSWFRVTPPSLPAASRRRSSGCKRSRPRAPSPSAARRSPPRRLPWV